MSKTILIVEDNENDMMLVRDVLQSKGYTVLDAVTGAEGVRIAIEAKPDLVLMDIGLPDIDGIAALAQIRANEASRGIPMLAVSASEMPDEKQRIVASGFDAYITKPLNMKSFVETIEKFIGNA